jgi:hypothetical protein
MEGFMNQSYAEVGVKKKDNMQTMLMRALLVFGIIVGLFLVFLGSFFSLIGLVLVVAMVFLFPRLNVEYEYVFVDGQIDFDRITAKSKRKTLLRIDMEQVEIVAQQGSHALDEFNNSQCENKDYTSGNKDSKPYIIIASVENKRYRIACEPNEKMLDLMKQKSPRKISQV